jgi:hypothetical protein
VRLEYLLFRAYIIAVVSFLLILLVLNITVVDFAMDFMANGYKMISVILF